MSQAEAADKARVKTSFVQDTIKYFDTDLTSMHSLPPEELHALQLDAMATRFEQQIEKIPVLKTLAERQNIRSIKDVNDIVPVMFEHTMYKSYPITLLENSRFDRMTEWLNKLTSHDLSSVDASKCDSIDSWLDAVADQSDVDATTSSGSSGTMSFMPKDRGDWGRLARGMRISALQTFGVKPTQEDLHGKIDVIWPSYRDGHMATFRTGNYFREYFAGGDETMYHTVYPGKGSCDVMFLAGRLRAAAVKGADPSKLKIPANLLARRGELEAMQKDMPAQQEVFMQDLATKLRGKRVFGTGTWNLFHGLAMKGLASGVEGVFAPNSSISTGGGAKGMVVPDDWEDVVKRFYGVSRINLQYGMTEQSTTHALCEHGNYHFFPTAIPFVLDADTSVPLPRTGVQRGRGAFFDISLEGHWGGITTGDHIELHFDADCACGRKTIYADKAINRFTELTGNEDKITCAATPEAHGEAMEFLTGIST